LRADGSGADPSLTLPAWGALWGVGLGAWLLGPAITDAHHIHPSGPGQWAIYLTALVVIFSVMGAFLAFIAGFGLAIIERLTVGAFRDRVWAYGLGAGALVIAAYAAEACLIHVLTFGSLDRLSAEQARQLGVPLVIMSGLLIAAYLLLLRRSRPPKPASLAWVLTFVATAGMLSLIPWSVSGEAPSTEVGPLTRDTSSEAGDVPLLFIGLDGATWRVLKPAIENGKAPTLRSLLENGAYGTVGALWPPYWSGAAWGSIVTGLPRETTGVYEDLAILAPGLPPFQAPLAPSFQLNPIFVARAYMHSAGLIQFVRPTRPLLNGKPVWELLHDAGVGTAVIRFRFTYPPGDEADVIVSDWVGDDGWAELGARHRETDDTAAPRERAPQLLAPFRTANSTSALFDRLLPDREEASQRDSLLDPIKHLRAASALDEATFSVAASVLNGNRAQPFLAIYFVGLDSVQHLFWQYRFPEEFGTNRPPEDEIRRFGKVMDRYVEYFDQQLNLLLNLYATRPNVVIVSDHGQGAASTSTMPSVWLGTHTKDGIFLAAGPSITKVTEPLSVSYYDILPTLVDLKGFSAPAGLTGQSILSEP
jgi:Type I phosphodiesterase / nucleotide pyrophosphatase